jgi:cysteine dioxygenase
MITKLQTELSILDWVRGLAAISAQEFTEANVLRYLTHNGIDRPTLTPYLFFSSKCYTRNLIYKNDVFECLAVCWDIGQSSSIHDHSSRLGWMYLVEGRLFVQNYSIEARDTLRRTCRVVPTNFAELSVKKMADVDHEDGVHKVCNLRHFQRRAISLHIYQRPMDQCEIYSLENGTFETINLSFTSEYGRLCPGISLA